MYHLALPAMTAVKTHLLATQVHVLASLEDGNDGTSNGSLFSIAWKIQLAAGAIALMFYIKNMLTIYAAKPGGGGGPNGQGGGGKQKTMLEETQHFAVLIVAITFVSVFIDAIVLPIAQGFVH
ncbi:hypothetical protein B5P44_00295 [Mycobacterium sp. CBMA 213]|uniref:Uncharacterized protein n=2 Tax=Mycolicibacterium TaxID=1866885 RepID=A0A343VR37_9MYCO|nr:hypothetical protein [Mycolicibacterium sp. CBMA 213]AVN58361.1 hypothetical protein B5P44_p00066 [Mycolicibacterium sp. CBMA 213]MUM03262.1 hypothetical protein [Mycolicibacterium sp. CBMA 213]